MKEVLLTIVTKQPGAEGDITFTTRSECEETDSGIKLYYEENLSDEDAVNTTLFIGEDSILVERTGDTGADMYFKDTATYETQYKAFGGISLDMRIFTTSLDINKNENGIKASVDYQLFLGGASVGRMGMDIMVEYL